MNRFKRFLEESGIAAGHRHSVEERASYFVWYHTTATDQPDADLEIISAYLVESGTSVPDLHELYEQLSKPGHLVGRGAFPGRLRLKDAKGMNDEYKKAVFDTKGLAPLYFIRNSGLIVRVGSWKDRVKYWPQQSWLAFWISLFVGVIGIVLALALPVLPLSQPGVNPQPEIRR